MAVNTSWQHKVKILCVDDTPANLIALKAALSLPDYELICVNSGAEALSMVQNDDFAVILLDVQMPVLDGFQTAKLIRQFERTRLTPIIFLTANYPTEQYILQGYEAGAVDYLFKPLNTQVLSAKVSVFVDLFRTKVDIRQLRKAEQELRQALRVRDEFLSIASHELKTPITPLQLQMQGFVRLIETGRLSTTPLEKLKYMLEISDSQVTRLARLIDQLLDVSRMNEGRLLVQREDVNLGETIHTVLEQLQHEIEASECKISLKIKDDVQGQWDRLRLEQVVINLMTNALKYAAQKSIELELSSNGEYAKLVVRDNGIGIAKEDQSRIFGRFERAVPSKNYGGLGLGLYITRQIVELHRGTIQVKSTPNEGATFIVELPLNSH